MRRAALSITGGSRSYAQPAFSYGGRTGKVDYFLAGQYQIRNGLGVGIGGPQFGQRQTFLLTLAQKF